MRATTRSYLFHRGEDAIWSLVFQPAPGGCHVEKRSANGARRNFTIDDFEASEHGWRLKKPFEGALREAENDL
jgi:hypothetical protein